MYEIFFLPKDGDPTKDWGMKKKLYKKYSTASAVMTRMMNTGKYDRAICTMALTNDLDATHAKLVALNNGRRF